MWLGTMPDTMGADLAAFAAEQGNRMDFGEYDAKAPGIGRYQLVCTIWASFGSRTRQAYFEL